MTKRDRSQISNLFDESDNEEDVGFFEKRIAVEVSPPASGHLTPIIENESNELADDVFSQDTVIDTDVEEDETDGDEQQYLFWNLALLLAFTMWSNNNMGIIESSTNEWRSLFNQLLENGIIKMQLNCRNLNTDLVADGTIPVNSASRSRQFREIQLTDNLSETIIITLNDEVYELLGRLVNDVTKIENAILNSIDRLKDSIFLKVYADVVGDRHAWRRMNREVMFYKELRHLISQQICPNFTSFYFDFKCPVSSPIGKMMIPDDNVLGGVNKEIVLREYFERDLKPKQKLYKFHILAMESVSTTTLTQIMKTIDTQAFLEILVQIVWTIMIMGRANMVHNDLHAGNILIEKLSEPVNLYYVLGPKYVIQVRTQYFVRIFDFDQSYSMADKVGYDNPRYKNLENRFDLYYFAKWLQYVTRAFKLPEFWPMINSLLYQNSSMHHDYYMSSFDPVLANSVRVKTKKEIRPVDVKNYYVRMYSHALREMTTSYNLEMSTMTHMYTPTDWLLNTLPNFIEKMGDSVTIWDSLAKVPINDKTEINILTTDMIADLLGDISQNGDWNGLEFWEKAIICYHLIHLMPTDELLNQIARLVHVVNA